MSLCICIYPYAITTAELVNISYASESAVGSLSASAIVGGSVFKYDHQ